MWELKAGLVEQVGGVELAAPAIIFPKIEEFAWIPSGAGETAGEQIDLGAFTGLQSAGGKLRLRKPDQLPESLWWTVGTGGVKGVVERHDERELVIGGN